MHLLSWNQIGKSGLEARRKTWTFLSSVYVVRTSARYVIPGRWSRENGCEVYKNEKRRRKECKTTVFYCWICKFMTFSLFSSWFLNTFVSLLRFSFFLLFYFMMIFSVSLIKTFLPGIFFFFFQLLRLLPKSETYVSLCWFQSLRTPFSALWILKVRPYYTMNEWLPGLLNLRRITFCWFGGSVLSTSWNVVTAASTPQINVEKDRPSAQLHA